MSEITTDEERFETASKLVKQHDLVKQRKEELDRITETHRRSEAALHEYERELGLSVSNNEQTRNFIVGDKLVRVEWATGETCGNTVTVEAITTGGRTE